MKKFIWLGLLLSSLSFGQVKNAVDGIKITSSIHVYVQKDGEDKYTKLSSDKELLDYFSSSSMKIYEYQDFYLDFIRQHKTLKKVENQIATGNYFSINRHLKELKEKGITDFAVVFSIVDADVKKKTITLYDIGDVNDQNYRQLSRITLKEKETLKPEDINNLFYLGMVTINQEEVKSKKEKDIAVALESIRQTLELNELAMDNLQRKAREINDHVRINEEKSDRLHRLKEKKEIVNKL